MVVHFLIMLPHPLSLFVHVVIQPSQDDLHLMQCIHKEDAFHKSQCWQESLQLQQGVRALGKGSWKAEQGRPCSRQTIHQIQGVLVYCALDHSLGKVPGKPSITASFWEDALSAVLQNRVQLSINFINIFTLLIIHKWRSLQSKAFKSSYPLITCNMSFRAKELRCRRRTLCP